MIQNLERLDLSGCINLLEVHPSIGLLTSLVFLSLQNCSSLVSLDFGNAPRLRYLKVLRLSDCTKLENTPNFSGLSNLQYLDMDRCASLSTIHESVGALADMRFLSLRDCANLVAVPNTLYNIKSLITLDLYGCPKFTKLPLGVIFTSPLQSLIYLDLSLCSISIIPDAIGELSCLERLNLQGNNFAELPPSFGRLHNLSYLNLSHCHKLRSFPELQTVSGSLDSAGRYFKTTSGSRNHRSGFYVFDTPKCTNYDFYEHHRIISWILTLVKVRNSLPISPCFISLFMFFFSTIMS
jgi:Leucine-rich repeat (LRR) protein